MKCFTKIFAAISLLTILGSSVFNHNVVAVDGYFEDTTELKDNFDSKTIDSSKWASTNAETNIENYSLRFHPSKYEWVDQLMLEAENTKFTKSFVMEVELSSNADRTAWQGFSFGLTDKNLKFSDAPFALIFFPSYLNDTSLTAFCANTEKSGYLEPVNSFLYATPFDKPNVFRRLRITVNLIDSKSSSVFYDVLDTSGNYIKQHADKDVIQVNSPLTGYVGFNNSGIETTFKNIKYTDLESGNILYQDDFTKSSIQYATQGEGVWTTTTFSKDDVVLGPSANLKLKGNDSSIVSYSKFCKSQYDTIDCLFSQQLTLTYSPMTNNSVAGLEISKPSMNENGYLFGLKKNDNGFGYSLVIYDNKLNLIDSVKSNVDASGTKVVLLLKTYFDNTCVFSTNELSLTVKINTVEGYFGVKNISIDSNPCEGPNCDDFSMIRTIDVGCDANDVGINFDGTKESKLGQLNVKQFYICKNEWQYSSTSDFMLSPYEDSGVSGVSPNGYAIFDNCNNMTIFGTKQKYKNYVVRFDIQILTKTESLKESAGFALEYGLDKYDIYYDNAQSLGLYTTKFNNSPISQGLAKHSTLIDGGDTKLFPLDGEVDNYRNFFEKRNNDYAVLNVVYIVKDGYVSMFFKYNDEPEEVLLKPRMIAKADDSTSGYCCVIGTGGITFTLDNFSLTNLDYVEKDEKYVDYHDASYQITTRKDFRVDGSDTSGLVLENAILAKKSIEINNGGTVKTKGLTLNGLTRVRLNSLEESVEFKYGSTSVFFVSDETGKYVLGKDSNGVQRFDLDKDFQFANALVEIEKIDETFNVSLCPGNKPLSAIENNKISFILSGSATYCDIEIFSNGLTRLSTFTYVNYDTRVILTARNFDPETDSIVSWVEKTSLQDLENKDKKGCAGSILGTSIIVTALCFAICTLLTLRRKENN